MTPAGQTADLDGVLQCLCIAGEQEVLPHSMTEESPGLLYYTSKFTLCLSSIAEMVQRRSQMINLGTQAVVQLACCTHPLTCI